MYGFIRFNSLFRLSLTARIFSRIDCCQVTYIRSNDADYIYIFARVVKSFKLCTLGGKTTIVHFA